MSLENQTGTDTESVDSSISENRSENVNLSFIERNLKKLAILAVIFPTVANAGDEAAGLSGSDKASFDIMKGVDDSEKMSEELKKEAYEAMFQAAPQYFSDLNEIVRKYDLKGHRLPSPDINHDPLYSKFLYPMMIRAQQEGIDMSSEKIYGDYLGNLQEYKEALIGVYLAHYEPALDQLNLQVISYLKGGNKNDMMLKQDDLDKAIRRVTELEVKILDISSTEFPGFEDSGIDKKNDEPGSNTKYQYEIQTKMTAFEGASWGAKFTYLSGKFSEYSKLLDAEKDPTVRDDLRKAVLLIIDYRHNLGSPTTPSGNKKSGVVNSLDSDDLVSFGPAYNLEKKDNKFKIPQIEKPEQSSEDVDEGLFADYERNFWVIVIAQYNLEWQSYTRMYMDEIKAGKEVPDFDYIGAYRKAIKTAKEEMSGINVDMTIKSIRYGKTEEDIDPISKYIKWIDPKLYDAIGDEGNSDASLISAILKHSSVSLRFPEIVIKAPKGRQKKLAESVIDLGLIMTTYDPANTSGTSCKNQPYLSATGFIHNGYVDVNKMEASPYYQFTEDYSAVCSAMDNLVDDDILYFKGFSHDSYDYKNGEISNLSFNRSYIDLSYNGDVDAYLLGISRLAVAQELANK